MIKPKGFSHETSKEIIYDMKGKVAIVTGASSGIGKEIATKLTLFGAEVVLACRDLTKGRLVAAEIKEHSGCDCAVMEFDAASISSVREFAQSFQKKYKRLDVLVNNAGTHQQERILSKDGIELTFATNVLGYFLLTNELSALLKKNAPSRVVNVASTYASDLDLDDLEYKSRRYNGQKAYAQSKACDRLLSWAFARRLHESGVTVNAMSPGFVMTGLYRQTRGLIRVILGLVNLIYGRSIAEGADTVLWLAASPEAQELTGKFFEKRIELPCEFKNHDDEDKLWAACEEMVKKG